MSFRKSTIQSIDRRVGDPHDFVLNLARIIKVENPVSGEYDLFYKEAKANGATSILRTTDSFYYPAPSDTNIVLESVDIPVTNISGTTTSRTIAINPKSIVWATTKSGVTSILYNDTNNRLREVKTSLSLDDLVTALNAGTVAANTESQMLQLVDPTSTVVVLNDANQFRMPVDATITAVELECLQEPTGADIIVDTLLEYVSITPVTKARIPDGTSTSVGGGEPVLTTTAVSRQQRISFDITQVGSSVPGTGLKVRVFYTPT